jgi:hypothetical protein
MNPDIEIFSIVCIPARVVVMAIHINLWAYSRGRYQISNQSISDITDLPVEVHGVDYAVSIE